MDGRVVAALFAGVLAAVVSGCGSGEKPIAARATPSAAPLRTPLPQRPSGPGQGTLISIAGAPARGSATARGVLVEFSDYQCPFCRKFFRETLPQIERDYVATGKLRYVFKNLPIAMLHPKAPQAHEAALCAGDQGKYWALHARFFANPRTTESATLGAQAQAIGVDAAAFQQCLAARTHEEHVRRDLQEAEKLGIVSTPSFVIGKSVDAEHVKTVRFVVGALPYPDFKAALDGALAAP